MVREKVRLTQKKGPGRMQCFYINLEHAHVRRKHIEESFQLHCAAGWTLTRFPALDAQYVRQRGIEGRIRDNEKACFASHRELIRATMQDERPILVLEDDAMFCSRTFPALERYLGAESDDPWDLTFTDVLLPDLPSIVLLAQLRQEWERRSRGGTDSEFFFIDLARVNFSAATAYVVHGRSKAKLVGWLESSGGMDLPYDLFLRKLIHEHHLKARSIFPFVTTLAPVADASQMQLAHDEAPNLIWNTFRRLMWVARDVAAEEAALARISQELCEADSRALGTIVAATLSVFKPR
jgi:GR25 family glycosyltransferase involved in LPS biosynthesis